MAYWRIYAYGKKGRFGAFSFSQIRPPVARGNRGSGIGVSLGDAQPKQYSCLGAPTQRCKA